MATLTDLHPGRRLPAPSVLSDELIVLLVIVVIIIVVVRIDVDRVIVGAGGHVVGQVPHRVGGNLVQACILG